jgi:putative ABC transport system permease protein
MAVILAAIGLYGLVSYAVELRRREAAIRLALGASPGVVMQQMIRSVNAAAVAGGAAGIAGALAAGRWLQSELFGVSGSDPLVLAAASAALAAVTLLATWVPARRAARVPPAIVLQEE